jgi:hypothetical protein
MSPEQAPISTGLCFPPNPLSQAGLKTINIDGGGEENYLRIDL